MYIEVYVHDDWRNVTITKWLTRDEWNAAYFAYCFYQATSKYEIEHDIDLALKQGICVLDKVGYKNWVSIKVRNNSDFFILDKNPASKFGNTTCSKDGYNNAVLAEIMLDEIDYVGRIKETISWISTKKELHPDFKEIFLTFCNSLLNKILEETGGAHH